MANHGRRCTCRSCCRAEATVIIAQQQAEYAAKDHGGDRSREDDWHKAAHGLLSGDALGYRPVTFALGFGTRDGEVLITDGFVSTRRPGPFWQAGGHTYYGKGQGVNISKPNRGIEIAPPLVTNDRAEQRQAEAIGRRWVRPDSVSRRIAKRLLG